MGVYSAYLFNFIGTHSTYFYYFICTFYYTNFHRSSLDAFLSWFFLYDFLPDNLFVCYLDPQEFSELVGLKPNAINSLNNLDHSMSVFDRLTDNLSGDDRNSIRRLTEEQVQPIIDKKKNVSEQLSSL